MFIGHFPVSSFGFPRSRSCNKDLGESDDFFRIFLGAGEDDFFRIFLGGRGGRQPRMRCQARGHSGKWLSVQGALEMELFIPHPGAVG